MKRKHFTLVELLVAIGIIVVLAGMLLGGVTVALAKGEQAQAKTDMVTLKNAIAAFELEYNKLPKPKMNSSTAYDGSVLSGDQYKWLIETLQGTYATKTGLAATHGFVNPKQKKFLEVQGNTPGEWKDPWNQDYKVIFEERHDKGIENTASGKVIGGMNSSPIHQPVVIWSVGEDGEDYVGNNKEDRKKNKDNIYSVNTNWNEKERYYEVTR